MSERALSEGGVALSDEERAVLRAVAEALISADGEMPSAAEVGVAEKWVDRVLRAIPIKDQLKRALRGFAETDPANELARLEREDPETLATLKFVIAASYYMAPRVRRLIGYPGQTQKPILPDESEYWLEGDLLAPVLARGPIFRPVSGHA